MPRKNLTDKFFKEQGFIKKENSLGIVFNKETDGCSVLTFHRNHKQQSYWFSMCGGYPKIRYIDQYRKIIELLKELGEKA